MMWKNTFETEQVSDNFIRIYEPIKTIATQDCEPYCCFIRTVIFYKKPLCDLVEVDRTQTHFDLLGKRFSDELDGWTGVAPFVEHDGKIYELISGTVIWRNGAWYMQRMARRICKDDPRLPFINFI